MTATDRPTLITWAQRCILLDILEAEQRRREQHVQQLDDALTAEGEQYDVMDDVPNFERKADALNRALADADAADSLLATFEGAKIITTRPALELDPVATIARCLVAAHVDGVDVGEVLVLAVAGAQRTVHASTEDWLTSHRPGSWEASLLEQIIESSGWDRC